MWSWDQVLEKVDTFNYVVRIISFGNINSHMVDCNHHIYQNIWGRFSCMFYEEADDTRTFGRFYLVIVKSVLLFGSKSWVVTPCILWDLSIFHNWVE